jgi:hypothetical protein
MRYRKEINKIKMSNITQKWVELLLPSKEILENLNSDKIREIREKLREHPDPK